MAPVIDDGVDEGFGEELSAGAVARRLGVAVTTLRTWHQRYGLGPSRHQPGHHRRYDADDLLRLEVMRQLTAQGLPAAEAARIALANGSLPDATSEHAISGAPSGFAARGLARAAMRLDTATVRGTIELSLSQHGVVRTWDELLRPALKRVSDRHVATGRLVEVEHVLSRCASEAMTTVPRPPASAPHRILLACGGEEQHSLPLEALAAALAERGVASRLLGARVPAPALLDSVRRTGPRVVVLWAHAEHTADLGHLDQLRRLPRPPSLIVAAGPGWPADLPEGVSSPTNLDEAVTLCYGLLST